MRKSNIELLRFFLCLTVIAYHAYSNASGIKIGQVSTSNNMLFLILSPYIGAGVCVFAIISGYFMINQKRTRGLRILVTIFYALIFLTLFNLVLALTSDKFNNEFSWYKLLTQGTTNFWYIWAFLFVSLISPMLNWIIKSIDFKLSLLIIFLMYIGFYIDKTNLNYSIFISIRNIYFLSIYYLMGAWIRHNYSYFNKKIDYLFIIGIFGLVTITIINLTYVLINQTNLMFGNSNFSSLFTATSIFLVFNKIKIKENNFINFLGKLSIYVYFFHYLINRYLLIVVDPIIFSSITNASFLYLLIFLISTSGSIIFALIILYPLEYLVNTTCKFIYHIFNIYKLKFNQKNLKIK